MFIYIYGRALVWPEYYGCTHAAHRAHISTGIHTADRWT